jgi:hypothetical protein
MNSYFGKCKIFKPNKKNENNSTIEVTDDSESLIEEMMNLQKIKSAKLINSNVNKTIHFFNVKHLPSLFFIIFMVVLAIILSNSIPHFYRLSRTKMLYKYKFEIKYISQIISEQTQACKVFLLNFYYRLQ